jgi:hypothetical protein
MAIMPRLERAHDAWGGSGGNVDGTPGGAFSGGKGGLYYGTDGGGGGGGYYGGGGGSATDPFFATGGGGGSSLFSNLKGVVGEAGSGMNAGGMSDPFYISGVGLGGNGSQATVQGGDGLIVISFDAPISVPEPASIVLLGSGSILGLIAVRRKCRRGAAAS